MGFLTKQGSTCNDLQESAIFCMSNFILFFHSPESLRYTSFLIIRHILCLDLREPFIFYSSVKPVKAWLLVRQLVNVLGSQLMDGGQPTAIINTNDSYFPEDMVQKERLIHTTFKSATKTSFILWPFHVLNIFSTIVKKDSPLQSQTPNLWVMKLLHDTPISYFSTAEEKFPSHLHLLLKYQMVMFYVDR